MKNYQRKDIEHSFKYFDKIDFLKKKSNKPKISNVNIGEYKNLAESLGVGWIGTTCGAEWTNTINDVEISIRVKKTTKGNYEASFGINSSDLLKNEECESISTCFIELTKCVAKINHALAHTRNLCINKVLSNENEL
jgi:hypothetical protein